MAKKYGKRKKGSRKKSGKKRSRPCPSNEGIGVTNAQLDALTSCQDYGSYPIPCRYMPNYAVRDFGKQCKIKGRSKKSKMQLCAALARRVHKPLLSERCATNRLSYVVSQRGTAPGSDYFTAPGLRAILRKHKIETPRYARFGDLQSLVLNRAQPLEQQLAIHATNLRELKKYHEQELHNIKYGSYTAEMRRYHKREEERRYKQALQTESDLHRRRMAELRHAAAVAVASAAPAAVVPSAPPAEAPVLIPQAPAAPAFVLGRRGGFYQQTLIGEEKKLMSDLKQMEQRITSAANQQNTEEGEKNFHRLNLETLREQKRDVARSSVQKSTKDRLRQQYDDLLKIEVTRHKAEMSRIKKGEAPGYIQQIQQGLSWIRLVK